MIEESDSTDSIIIRVCSLHIVPYNFPYYSTPEGVVISVEPCPSVSILRRINSLKQHWKC